MKGFFCIPLITVILPLSLFAQGPIAREINELIQSGNIEKAEKRVEFYLKKNPSEVDAIMMKGNVILNKECCERPVVLESNTDESIFSNSIGFVGDGGPMMVPKELGARVADLWKKAVSLDLSRTDIHYGICQIYSISMMTDELIDYLPALKKYVKGNNELHYSMCDYARNLKERGDFESAMKVYKYVLSIYPDKTGLYSDLAAEYFIHGDIDLAKEYIDKALEDTHLDEMSLGNAFFFNSVMGNYDDALHCLKRQAKITQIDDYLFYQGLLAFAKGAEWKSYMQDYLRIGVDDGWKTTAEFMLGHDFDDSFESYLTLNEMELNNAFKILIHQAYQTKIPDKLAPFFNYAELLTYHQLFDEAIQKFEEIEESNLLEDHEDVEHVAYYHGWALWKSGQRDKSLKKWKKLADSGNFRYKSASAYFYGKYYYDLDDKQKAMEYFRLVQSEASKSKYATMAWNYYNSLL